MKTCYSIDEENYCHESLDDAAQEVWEDGEHEVGDVVTVWEANAVEHKASWFVPEIAEMMRDQAYEASGEYSEAWNFDEAALQAAVEKAVDEWATANDSHPNFYDVRMPRPIDIKFVDDEGGFEIVDASQIKTL